jgi:hypothetical protein
MRTLKISLLVFVLSILVINFSFTQPLQKNNYSFGINSEHISHGPFIDTIYVPADKPTIQEGIDSAQTGDLVLVAEGTYIENIIFRGRNINLASYFILDGDESHIQNTIIDGSQSLIQNEGSTVTFNNYEDTSTVLCGFTITGGTGSYQGFMSGGGIRIYLATPIIENNIIENNIIDSPIGETGGGICAYLRSGSPLIIRNNIIRNNTLKNSSTHTYGGGIAIWPDDYTPYLAGVTIENNVIENNESLGNTFSFGGGILVYGGGPAWWATIRNNKIIGNTVSLASNQSYGGGLALNYTNSVVSNNLIVYNKAYESAGVKNIDEGSWSSSYINNTISFNEAIYDEGGISTGYSGQMLNCIIWGNQPNQFTSGSHVLDITFSLVGENYPGAGNFISNPSFIDTIYFLLDENISPCIDAGYPDPIYYDIEDPNNPGYALFPALGTLLNDIGHFGGPKASWRVTEVEDEFTDNCLLQSFSLSQNYPNPFNPSTVISYRLPVIGFVTLKVYDILGREIAALVSEEKTAGEYEVEFNAANLPSRQGSALTSGIYFYQLKAGEFTQTKKMILLR